MKGKEEAEYLMNEILPVAKKMLRQFGEFYPYGGYIKPNGEIVHVGAQDTGSEKPKSRDLIEIMQQSFHDMVDKKQCKAVAIAYDVVVPLPNSNRKSNAIQVCVDHESGYSAEVFFPYRKIGNEAVFDEVFAQDGEHLFFG